MKTIEVICGLIERDGKFLIGQRPFKKNFGGLWEFPGGTLEEEETDVECLYREIHKEEFPWMRIKIIGYAGEGHHKNEERGLIINLRAYYAEYVSGLSISKAHLMTVWETPKNIFPKYPLCPADIPIAKKLQELRAA